MVFQINTEQGAVLIWPLHEKNKWQIYALGICVRYLDIDLEIFVYSDTALNCSLTMRYM